MFSPSRITLLFSLAAVPAIATANQCIYDLNADGKCDAYSVTAVNDNDSLHKITITPSNAKEVSGLFNTGSGGIAPGYFPGDIFIPIEFESVHTVEQRAYTFRWQDKLKNWVLIKESNWLEPYRDEIYSLGEEPMPNEAHFPRDFSVNRIKCCVKLTDFSSSSVDYQVMNKNEARKEVDDEIKKLKALLPQGKKSQLFYSALPMSQENRKPIPSDFVYELSMAVSEKNVGALNDYAYYMQQAGNNVLAAILLKSIHEKFPNRVVATLNLADSYWDIGMRDSACFLYREYSEEMGRLDKKKLIPERVQSRSKCESK